LSILARRLQKKAGRERSKGIRATRLDIISVSTKFTEKTPHRLKFISRARNQLFSLFYLGTTPLFSRTDRQERERLLRWKALSTVLVRRKEESSRGRSKKSSPILARSRCSKAHSWYEPATCRFIMRLSQTCLRASEPVCRSEKMLRGAFSLRDFLSGQFALLEKLTIL